MGGCHLWGKVGSRSIAALSWKHPGREGPGDQGWRPGHWRHAESAGLMGALGHLFWFSVVLGWGLSPFRKAVGKRHSYLYVSSLNGLSSTNLPTFNVQKQCVRPAFFIFLRWAYWHLLPLWRPVMPETVSSSWVEGPGEDGWHRLSERQGLLPDRFWNGLIDLWKKEMAGALSLRLGLGLINWSAILHLVPTAGAESWDSFAKMGPQVRTGSLINWLTPWSIQEAGSFKHTKPTAFWMAGVNALVWNST